MNVWSQFHMQQSISNQCVDTLLDGGWLSEERRFVLTHRGLAHPFFERLSASSRSMEFLQRAARQIYHVVLGFPFHIAGAIGSCRDERVLRALVLNLYAEVGGSEGEAHINLYRKFLRGVQASVDRPEPDELWAETVELERTCGQLYRSENMGTKLGSLFAFELMSSPMVSKWDSALRQSSLLQPPEFEFFTIHIEIEADHVEDILHCCSPYVSVPSFRPLFHLASEAVMCSLERFWDRLDRLALQLTSQRG